MNSAATPMESHEKGANRSALLPIALTIFAGAFLLFLVQPTVAKMVLPWFGGSAAVWTVAMLFFQLLLLFGYLYAHAIQRLGRNRFLTLHLSLLALSLLSLPLLPSVRWKPTGSEDPTSLLLGLSPSPVGSPISSSPRRPPDAGACPIRAAWEGRRPTAAPTGSTPFRISVRCSRSCPIRSWWSRT
ncbi:MAG: hypothetical protein IPF66_18650 [Holophagales bacterium]|nr:hypothetical protein [Holophagales bacterium]